MVSPPSIAPSGWTGTGGSPLTFEKLKDLSIILILISFEKLEDTLSTEIRLDGSEFDATYESLSLKYTFWTSESKISFPNSNGVPELFALFNFFLTL